jgi:NDP-sugar pyrophosphorylase family protein
VVGDVWLAAFETLTDYSGRGIDCAFVADASVYTECDLIDLFWFHRGTRQAITRAFDKKGCLDFWIADCAKLPQEGFPAAVKKKRGDAPSYFISEYVNRLAHARDIRQFVTDILCGRCETRPSGKEIRPGVWVDEGAQIHRRARIVAPAYIGRQAKVWEDTLITRCSNVESLCYVDYGTVVEDSSVLTNSYIGIWLDVSHAVVGGTRLMNLQRNVLLEISDPSLIREHVAASKTGTPALAPSK